MACDTILDSYVEANRSGYYDLEAIFNARESAISQSFTTPAVIQYGLCSAVFHLRKIGSPVGNMVVRLYAHTGVFGTSSKPTGAHLAESNPIAMASIGGIFALQTFTFNAPYYAMNINTNYCIVILVKDATLVNSSNKVIVGIDSSVPTHAGNIARMWNAGAWLSDGTIDCVFYVYGEAIVEAGAPSSIASMMTVMRIL